METLREKIYNSLFYSLVVGLIDFAKNSVFFKGHIDKDYREKSEFTDNMILIRWLKVIGNRLEKLFAKIREAFFGSAIITKAGGLLRNIADNSIAGRLIKEFNLVFILALYVYVDKFIRLYVVSISSIWDELFFIIVIMWLVIKRVLGGKKYRFSTIGLPIILFAMLYLFLVFINSPELNVAIEGYRAVVQYMFWFFLVLQLIDSEKTAYRTIWTFTIGIGLIGLHGIYQYVTDAPMLGNWVDSSETLTTRAYSIIGSPNALASLLVLFIPLGFSVFVAEEDIIKKIIALIFTAFMGLGLIFTFSRGAWIAAFIAIIAFLIFVGKRLILPICTALIAAIFSVDALWSRISVLFSAEYRAKSASGGRIYRYTIGLQEWSEHKLIGLGIGRYGGAVATNHNLTPFYMDNYYLKTLTESGLMGCSGFLILIIWTLRQAYLYIKSTVTTKYRIMSYGIYAGMIGVLIHNFVENIFETPFMVTYFWTCAALIVAIGQLEKQDKVSKKVEC